MGSRASLLTSALVLPMVLELQSPLSCPSADSLGRFVMSGVPV